MPEKKIRIEKRVGGAKVRIEKHVAKGEDGKRRVVVIKKGPGTGDGEELEWEGEEEIDIDALLEDLEEEDENGHTVLKIRIPKIPSGEGGSDPLVRAAGVSGAIDNLESEISALVQRAREQGYTWTQIGQALGTSKQAAWERFSDED